MSGLFSLEGRRALVTGAGRGIGRGIALALAGHGAEVTLCARSADEIGAVADEIAAAGGKADALVLDVTDSAAFAREIAARPPYHVFVNNAGTNRPNLLADLTPDDYDLILGLNLRAAIFAVQAVAGRMTETGTGGSIINMSSQMGHVGAAKRSLYCASKWALEGFTKSVAIELGPQGIRVNTVCPTFIETPLTKPYFEDPAFATEVLGKIKLGRVGQVQDVVGAAVFLASDASSMTTGSAIMVDGGWTAE
ncbi:SDR family NAD(P)-dependent oxidoreductase [Salipiger thiooxidans]|uniref:SDR family NAD(P)-dependent oxidoreductase n=1 Tax=Salipiger thiooxidans TaxID=282683 RepID=UPI001CD5439F|nr:SDR family NAD(P)-dependent oxidoreductase [Salipiger thiooxidans]MCA0847958.1 SDR family oxidoreductase [Salipiger thiooxidans]